MKIDDKIIHEKLQYDINREAAKVSTLSTGRNDKHEYATGEEILPPDQKRVIEQAKFANFPQEKLLKNKQKQLKSKEKHKQTLLQTKTKDWRL